MRRRYPIGAALLNCPRSGSGANILGLDIMWHSILGRTGVVRYLSWLNMRRACLVMIPWLAITGCVAEEAGPDGTWQLASLDSSPIAATPETRLPSFTITGKTIEGFDGCNQFSGPIDRPGAISATRRACSNVENMLPMDLNQLDAHFQNAKVDGDTMTVPAIGSYPESTYVRRSG